MKTHTFFSVICGVSFFIRAMCIVSAYSVLSSIIYHLDILFLNHVYYTCQLDIVSYPLVALCGMTATLLDSSVSFIYIVDEEPMFGFATCIN